MTGRNSLRAALLGSCALMFPVQVLAQAQNEDGQYLGTIIIESKRDVKTDTATAVTEIDQEEIDDRQASTIAELISSVPGVTLINGNSPVGGGIQIRGFGATGLYGTNQKVMITIDGASQGSEELYRIGTQLFTDAELFKSVSVIRGTVGSFEYGSGIVGGLVQLETKDASDFTGGEIGYRLRQGLTFGTNGDGITSSTILAWQPSQDLEFMANYTWRRQGEQTDGDGNNLGSPGFKTPSFSLKGKYTFGAARDQFLSLSYTDSQMAERDVPYDAVNGNVATSTTDRVDRDIHYKTTVLTYGWNPGHSDLIDLRVILSYADSAIDNTSTTGSTTGLYNAKHEYETTKLTVKNTARFDTGSLSHEVRAGVELIQKDRKEAASAPGGRDKRVAFFLIDEMDFGNGFSVTPALRYESQNIANTGPNPLWNGEYDNDAVMGGVSLRYEFASGVSVFASGAYTESLPILDDFDRQAYTTGGRTYNYMTMSEKARTWEIGAAWRGSDLLSAGDAVSLKANLYQTSAWALTSESGVGSVDLRGVELEGAYSTDAGYYAEISANIVDNDSRSMTTQNWLGYYAQSTTDTLRLAVGKRWDDELDLSWEMFAAKAYSDTSTTCTGFATCPSPGYGVHNLRATYRPQSGVLEGTEIRFGIDNVFDRDYRARLATRDAPGRNVKLSIVKSF
ncbi:TonB-dependent heme receptor A precursor [Pseudogemmobacter humi]|uniref:TonB-dependent heme receptor A n=2 Tax=Pseudogemmobacter humi TaxID=2483812 RepID=A0A3P5X371_9RHOB|nr:TonB-dependent heme receptor A precursor [Pseudogemmobacter humi]